MNPDRPKIGRWWLVVVGIMLLLIFVFAGTGSAIKPKPTPTITNIPTPTMTATPTATATATVTRTPTRTLTPMPTVKNTLVPPPAPVIVITVVAPAPPTQPSATLPKPIAAPVTVSAAATPPLKTERRVITLKREVTGESVPSPGTAQYSEMKCLSNAYENAVQKGRVLLVGVGDNIGNVLVTASDGRRIAGDGYIPPQTLTIMGINGRPSNIFLGFLPAGDFIKVVIHICGPGAEDCKAVKPLVYRQAISDAWKLDLPGGELTDSNVGNLPRWWAKTMCSELQAIEDSPAVFR